LANWCDVTTEKPSLKAIRPLGQAPPRGVESTEPDECPHGHGGGPDLRWLVAKAVGTHGDLPTGWEGSPVGAAAVTQGHLVVLRLLAATPAFLESIPLDTVCLVWFHGSLFWAIWPARRDITAAAKSRQ
jgi:hypothetical protein